VEEKANKKDNRSSFWQSTESKGNWKLEFSRSVYCCFTCVQVRKLLHCYFWHFGGLDDMFFNYWINLIISSKRDLFLCYSDINKYIPGPHFDPPSKARVKEVKEVLCCNIMRSNYLFIYVKVLHSGNESKLWRFLL